jgi:hypothetical protein
LLRVKVSPPRTFFVGIFAVPYTYLSTESTYTYSTQQFYGNKYAVRIISVYIILLKPDLETFIFSRKKKEKQNIREEKCVNLSRSSRRIYQDSSQCFRIPVNESGLAPTVEKLVFPAVVVVIVVVVVYNTVGQLEVGGLDTCVGGRNNLKHHRL